MRFTVHHRDPASKARSGVIETAHGSFRTPAFMPVATKGAVKTLTPRDLTEMGVEIVLSNTYHLSIRPGIDRVEKRGGLHRFMGWDGPILTDSGGYQIFSLAKLTKITDEGANFQSHVDGKPTFFSPEEVVKMQERLGVDIAMPLDHVVANPSARPDAEDALRRTHDWLARSFKAHTREETALFGIVQGGLFRDLREQSVEAILQHDPAGVSVGGLSVGEKNDEMHELAAYTASLIPEDKPRYLMGVGTPEDIVKAVRAGYDLFDCVLPTRVARTGWAYTSTGILKMRNSKYAEDDRPIAGAVFQDCDEVIHDCASPFVRFANARRGAPDPFTVCRCACASTGDLRFLHLDEAQSSHDGIPRAGGGLRGKRRRTDAADVTSALEGHVGHDT